jgi:cysteinyl-tRNA synthetase
MQKRQLKLYNTETRKKEEILPSDGQTVRMYTCGPTVYNFAHIGNFRTYVFEDLLRRAIKFFGFSIRQAMNLTDVDDKTIKGALEKKIPLDAFTKPFKEAFFEDLKTLSIERVEHYPQATDYIAEMITIIQTLVEKGIAYRGHDGSIYFAIAKFPSYGRLSHLHLNALQVGASNRIAVDEYDKENASDFVLWKAHDSTRDGEIFWESPFGKGRPGWHIECSAMAMKLLGASIDIHVGGVDNMFPHHENEIAQSEAFSSHHFVKHWLHAEHLLVDHKKMSKSLGNFYTLRDLLNKGYTGRQIRYMLLQTHYRTQLNFTFAGLDAVVQTLLRLSDFIHRLQDIRRIILEKALPESPQNNLKVKKDHGCLLPLLENTMEQFAANLADDLNISPALAALFDMVREVNILCDQGKIGISEVEDVLDFLAKADRVLGVLPLKPEEEVIPLELEEALKKREVARAEKNWKMADEYRDLIQSHGYLIEDAPHGARLKKKDL